MACRRVSIFSPGERVFPMLKRSGLMRIFESARQYESSKRLARAHACHVLGRLLARRESQSQREGAHYLAAYTVSPALLPIVHRLKWSIQRDSVSRQMRSRLGRPLAEWIERLSPRILHGDERTRLAVCPGIRRIVKYYELLG
jgi:hypothetical protein